VYFWKLKGSGANTVLQRENLRKAMEHDAGIRSVAFSPDGDLLLIGSEDKLAKVWDVSTGEEKQVLKGHGDWVRSVAFHPKKPLALTASQDGTARVWNLQEKTPEVIHIAQHEGPVRWAAFSPDEVHFATAAADGQVRVWSLNEKEKMIKPIFALRGHDHEVSSIVYMDEKRLVTGSFDHTVRLWNKIEPERLDTLREKLGTATSHCLGSEEWERYIGGSFPDSSSERYKECMKKLTPERDPTPGVSTKGGE
jgi:WD40 repeat protein